MTWTKARTFELIWNNIETTWATETRTWDQLAGTAFTERGDITTDLTGRTEPTTTFTERSEP